MEEEGELGSTCRGDDPPEAAMPEEKRSRARAVFEFSFGGPSKILYVKAPDQPLLAAPCYVHYNIHIIVCHTIAIRQYMSLT